MQATFPDFSSIDVQKFPEQLSQLLKDNLQKIDALLQQKTYNWDNLMVPLEAMEDALERKWAPLTHLHAVKDSKILRECYEACLPQLSAYESSIGHNKKLYEAILSLDRKKLNSTQQKIIEDALLDFQLSGVALTKEKQHRFEAIQTRLSELTSQYENHVLDAENAFSLHITDEKRLAGLPEHVLHAAKELAQEKQQKGWTLNLEFPCYVGVITYAEDRELRAAMHKAYQTRASFDGPGGFDNLPLMNEILALRHEMAQLVGFDNYANLSIATKMAASTKDVMQFLEDLRDKSYQQGLKEFETLQKFAAETLYLSDLKPWDVGFVAEKMRKKYYDLSQETLRPYFPLDTVMQGLIEIVKRLYGMQMQEVKGMDIWHADVQCYAIYDENNQLRGHVYSDLFARPNKRGGAWMHSLQSRWKNNQDEVQLPIATLTCNFAKPSGNKSAILSHDEVQTLFHEFGHCLQHVLTQVEYLDASGIQGVEWDAVELPSQFFENWCWDVKALDLLTRHIETQEKLPKDLFEKLQASKNFQSAMAMLRQLEFALFDFRMHLEYQPNKSDYIQDILNQVRKNTTVVPVAAYNRFQNSFTHVFGGGYAAGYYSYKWAEVLSSDAFARFEEEGIFSEKAGRDFLHCVLETGGSMKAEDAYVAYRGKPATVDALLRQNGIGS